LVCGAGASWAAGEEQTPAAGEAAAAGQDADLASIKQAALDYAGSWYHGDRDLLEGAVYPELCKRRVEEADERGRQDVHHQGALRLMQTVAKGYGKQTPPEDRLAEVKILDVFGDTASVRLEMKGWIDYMHLGKVEGRWQIINVLWQTKPKAP
jgi:hypothetical protein